MIATSSEPRFCQFVAQHRPSLDDGMPRFHHNPPHSIEWHPALDG